MGKIGHDNGNDDNDMGWGASILEPNFYSCLHENSLMFVYATIPDHDDDIISLLVH